MQYQFYRILAAGMVSIYQPKAVILHKHRTSMAKLQQPTVNFQSGDSAILMRVINQDKDERAVKLLKYLPKDKGQRICSSLLQADFTALRLRLLETWGNLIGPFNFGGLPDTLIKSVTREWSI